MHLLLQIRVHIIKLSRDKETFSRVSRAHFTPDAFPIYTSGKFGSYATHRWKEDKIKTL